MIVSHRLFETITGRPISMPVRAEGSWRDSMTTRGSGNFSIAVPAAPFTPAQWRKVLRPWRYTLVELWDGVPTFAGLLKDRTWDPGPAVADCAAVTVDALLADRFPFGVNSAPGNDFAIVNASLRSAFGRAVARAIQTDGRGPEWELPFNLSHLAESGSFSKTWEWHTWSAIDDIVSEIRALAGGPDVAFIPTLTANGWLRWDVLAGNPRIGGPTIDLPASVSKPRLTNLRIREAGASMVSGTAVRGEGSGPDRPFGFAGIYSEPGDPGDALFPVRDVARNEVSVGDIGQLTSMANAYLGANMQPITQLEFSLHVDGDRPIAAGQLRLGSRLNIRYSGDRLYDPFTRTGYVVALAHDTARPTTFTPEVQLL